MNNYDDTLRQELNDDFEKHIPSIYIRQINHTRNATKIHFPQLKSIHYLYGTFRFHHPRSYLSKSGIRIGTWDIPMCKNPYDEGTIENMLLFLEKQYFDCISLLFSGSYRPITIILRYMLELTTWSAVSILNKKKLTALSEDSKKAMSHIQFESFLSENFEKMQKLRSPETPNEDKKSLNPIQSIQLIPEQFVRFLTFQNYSRNNAIKQLHSELSKYAHANIFRQLRWDGGDNETHIENIGLFVGKLNRESYHLCLNYILKTHEMIFYLLLVSTYENIGYYKKELAENLFTTMRKELVSVENNLKFKNLEKLLNSSPEIKHFVSDKETIENHIISESTGDDESDEDDEYEDLDCPKCGESWHNPNEECISCHIFKYGKENSADNILF